MKVFIAVGLVFLWGATLAKAQSRAGQPPAEQQTAPAPRSDGASAQPLKVDPAKEADIRRLMDVTGAKALTSQVMAETEKSLRPILTSSFPPGDYRDKLINLFFERFRSKLAAQDMVGMAVPIYDKYLSDEEIKGLIAFYETPLGQKTITVLPRLSTEMQAEGSKMGQEMGRQSMLEVLAEHPDLAKALQEAQKPAHPQ